MGDPGGTERRLLALAGALAALEGTSRSLPACRGRDEVVAVLRAGLGEPLQVETLGLYAIVGDRVGRQAASPEDAELPEHLALVGADGRSLLGGETPGAVPVRLGSDGQGRVVETLRGPEGPEGLLLLQRRAGAPPLTDAQQTVLGLVTDQAAAVVRSVLLLEELRRRALFDDLTGVAARGHFLTELRREMARSRRTHLPLSVLLIDADHFKAINDGHGHAVGDAVLRALAAALRAGTRDSDLVGRLGGEEFAVLLPHAEAEGAKRVAERLRASVQALRVRAAGASLGVTVSVGAAVWREGQGPEELLAEADRALYRAKESGRNRVEA